MALLDWMTDATGPVVEGQGVLLRPLIGETLPVLLRGHQYQARLLPGAELTANPLNLLAYDLAGVDDVGQWSLVVAGRDAVQGVPGFILLATRVDAGTGNEASAEELQDHACSVLTGAGNALERVR